MALELTHHFSLNRPVDEVFATIVDLERLVPCVEGGKVLARTGPRSVEAEIEIGGAGTVLTFKGSVELVELDDSAHRALLEVKSKELSGQGDANATVEFTLTSEEGTINTDARLSGTPMSMGESIPLGILDAMVADFAETLAQL
jgi:carbon monoxide dehydrogenase subunit G